MNNVIKQLWYGNICPQTDCRLNTTEIKQLSDTLVKYRKNLILSMNEEQSEIFDKLDACLAKYITITEEAVFSYGFKLGMRISSEAHEAPLEK